MRSQSQRKKARRFMERPASPSGAQNRRGPQRTLWSARLSSSLPFDLLQCAKNLFSWVPGKTMGGDADTAHVLTLDEAHRIAANIAKLPTYLAANPDAANE
jgi:hypothetical protein